MRRSFRLFALLLPALLLLPEEAAARRGEDALTLRVNDAIAKPGGVVAVVLRTYAPRPVRQGQVIVRVKKRPRGRGAAAAAALTPFCAAANAPVAALTGAVVYSTRRDSVSRASLLSAADAQMVMVQFESPSGTVNASDGPLAVLRMRLGADVQPGEVLDLQVDLPQSFLTDAQGRRVVLEPRDATLTVRAPNAPFQVEAEGDEVEPGETAELGFQTFEPFAVASGQVALRYPPRLAAGPPVVRMDPRYGKATFTVDTSTPGLVVVSFRSPDRSLNSVPGTIVAIDLPTVAGARPGTSTPVTLDPARTFLRNQRGRKINLRIENGTLAVED
jgi:hypothetical protein